MKAVIKGNDFECAVFIKLTPFAGELDSALVCFSTAIGKKDLVKAAVGSE